MNEPATLCLDVLRAEHGDCLVLHHGDDLILIDGGPSGVYDTALKPRLQELMAAHPVPLFIQLIMVSHIDNDHIIGLTDMFQEAVDRQENHLGPAEWRAGELWLNAFGALTGASQTADGTGVNASALDKLVATVPGRESQAVTAGVKSGVALHQDAIALNVDRNVSFGGGLVQRGGTTTVEVVPGLTFTVVAPTEKQLRNLQTKWTEWEQTHDQPDATAAENLDRAVFNLSSIVVLARSGQRTLLLTGDARSDHIIDGLKDAGLLTDDGPPLMVDVLKLPHHGSIRNVDARFFDRVRARHYAISANGRDGNPDNDTLTLLCDARLHDTSPWTLWLTYGGEPGDGKPGYQERVDAFLTARKTTQQLDVRFAKPGQRHTICL